MGRGKLNLELIIKKKARIDTFKKRKEGLIRKMHELTTLCDVGGCMIMYGPREENEPVRPEIWPQNIDEIHRIIGIYNSRKKDSCNKTFGLTDFFEERKKNIDDLSKLRKRNLKAKYPSPPRELLDIMNEGQLRAFALGLSDKAALVRAKIEVLKQRQVVTGMKGQFYPHPLNMHVPYPIYYPTTVDQESMSMLLMDGQDQLGGALCCNNIGGSVQCASFDQEIFYERSLPCYYSPPLSLPSHMVAPPQLPFSSGWENEDFANEDEELQELICLFSNDDSLF